LLVDVVTRVYYALFAYYHTPIGYGTLCQLPADTVLKLLTTFPWWISYVVTVINIAVSIPEYKKLKTSKR
jgi:hypothetical protein